MTEKLPSTAHCPVCGDGLEGKVINCTRCATPHHKDCFEYNKRCAVYACAPVPTLIENSVPKVDDASLTRWDFLEKFSDATRPKVLSENRYASLTDLAGLYFHCSVNACKTYGSILIKPVSFLVGPPCDEEGGLNGDYIGGTITGIALSGIWLYLIAPLMVKATMYSVIPVATASYLKHQFDVLTGRKEITPDKPKKEIAGE